MRVSTTKNIVSEEELVAAMKLLDEAKKTSVAWHDIWKVREGPAFLLQLTLVDWLHCQQDLVRELVTLMQVCGCDMARGNDVDIDRTVAALQAAATHRE